VGDREQKVTKKEKGNGKRQEAIYRGDGGRRRTRHGQHHVNRSAHTQTNTQERCR